MWLRIRSRWVSRWAQRASTLAQSPPSLSTCPLATTAIYRGPHPLHRLELRRIGGRNTTPTPSGTSTRPDTCHPARCKTTSKSFLSPAPRNRVKRRSTSEKASTLTVGSGQNSLSLIFGPTKPYT